MNATVETPQGPLALTFEFQVDDGNLTGTVSSQFMDPLPISEAMIMGDEIAFTLRFEDPNAMTLYYSGLVEDDEITLSTSFESGGPTLDTFKATRNRGGN